MPVETILTSAAETKVDAPASKVEAVADKAVEKVADKSVEKQKAETVVVPALGADGKPVVVADSKPVEIKYDLKLPENAAITDEAIANVSAFAKDHKLSNEQAQKMLERDNALFAAYQEGAIEAQQKQSMDWMQATKADKEIGGDHFAANVESARQLIVKHGNDALKKLLNDTGAGNHPEVVRFIAKIGKLMHEGQMLSGKPISEKPKAPRSLGDALYPDKPKV